MLCSTTKFYNVMDEKKYVFRATVNVTGVSWYFSSIDAVYNKYVALCNAFAYSDVKSFKQFMALNWDCFQSFRISEVSNDGVRLLLQIERIPLSM